MVLNNSTCEKSDCKWVCFHSHLTDCIHCHGGSYINELILMLDATLVLLFFLLVFGDDIKFFMLLNLWMILLGSVCN